MNDVAPPVTAAADDPRSRFYQGTILRLYSGSRSGLVRTGSGRDVPFAMSDVRLLGTDRGFAALREGMQVGFDLGWTSRGRRVTTIRLFD
ncbi:MAG: hypothetical protein HY271_01865 [Deltaproteobacteria bacterium]|nr:hypothetical protein [Deltaproteobacteria bacterium]